MHGWIKGGAQNNEPTGERGGFLFFMALFSLGVFVMIAYLFLAFLVLLCSILASSYI